MATARRCVGGADRPAAATAAVSALARLADRTTRVRLAAVGLRTRAPTVLLSAAGLGRTRSRYPRFLRRRVIAAVHRPKKFIHGAAMPNGFPAVAAAVIVLTAARILDVVG